MEKKLGPLIQDFEIFQVFTLLLPILPQVPIGVFFLIDEWGGPIEQYVNSVGIAEVAFEPIKDSQLITPYGAFPTAFVNLSVGLIWYHNMLVGSKMQGSGLDPSVVDFE